MRTRSIAAGTVVSMAALTLMACSQELNTGKAQTVIKTSIERQTGARVSSVSCPTHVAIKMGSTFSCTATAVDGTRAAISVRQTDGNGNVHINAPLLHVRDAEHVILNSIESRTHAGLTAVSCPELISLSKGVHFRCTLRAGTKGGIADAVATDASGNFHFEYRFSGPRAG